MTHAGLDSRILDRRYAQRWGLPVPSDHVRLQAGGLWNVLQLSPTSRVIDIGCGHGRHALALAERGPELSFRLDFAVALLKRARHLEAGLRTHVPSRTACQCHDLRGGAERTRSAKSYPEFLRAIAENTGGRAVVHDNDPELQVGRLLARAVRTTSWDSNRHRTRPMEASIASR